jgi:hypothetical protein
LRENNFGDFSAKLIKIGAKVVSHGRYIAFRMAEVHQHERPFREARKIATMRLNPVFVWGIPDEMR